MADPIVTFENYTWQYLNTNKAALDNINLEIEAGKFVGVIGPNGAGKTTLAYSIDGLIPGQYRGIKHGAVRVFDKEVEEYHRGELQQLVGVVFSDPEAQFTAMTVEDELVFGMENLGMNIPEIRERLDWVTELTDLKHLLNKPPYEISGGQKQRVALAAVLAMTPQVMILDEPTSMLDPVSRGRVFKVLEELKREKQNTIIVIEHSLENLIPLADQMVLVGDGQVVLNEPTHQFFQNMEQLLDYGIIPPGALHFVHKLKKAGIYEGDIPLTVEGAAEIITALFASDQNQLRFDLERGIQ